MSDLLEGPRDMGERVYAQNLAAALERHGVSVYSAGDSRQCTRTINRRTLLSPSLTRALRNLSPAVVLYAPRSSLTPAALMRIRVLAIESGAPVIPILFQPYELPSLLRGVSWLVPDVVFCASDNVAAEIRRVKRVVASHLLPAGVDVMRFKPPTPEDRSAARARFAIEPSDEVVLHVGHLAKGRGLEDLIPLVGAGIRLVVVASGSTTADVDVEAQLKDCGATLLTGYLDRIEDLYQAADVYVFPTRDPHACIGLPISVLEALASGLPVVTTRFGALPEAVGDDGVTWWPVNEDVVSLVERALAQGRSNQPRFTGDWDSVARSVVATASRVIS